ncbi:MAG TPA: class I SAM-dependent methyltransferase [Flavobacterium lutivivi]|nr:class I SAM-dependent methyltransferase [Flavobacterium lutivivi]
MTNNFKEHWENVYANKTPSEVSWTQEVPKTSLELIRKISTDKSLNIIDIGGGDSLLVDFLLAEGYTNITVLDISGLAIKRAQKRLGDLSNNVTWIVSDINDFKPNHKYDIWHDRAAFHFLTEDNQIKNYVSLVNEFVEKQLILSTFSTNGPLKCSGLNITQYSSEKMNELFKDNFQLKECIFEDHITPFNTVQNFIFCNFEKRNNL